MRAMRLLVAGSLVVVGNLPAASGALTKAAAAQVELVDKQFSPKEVTVKVGDTVAWHHSDGEMAHTVTADDNSFDSNPACPQGPCMQQNDKFNWTFPKPGRYPYHCKVHSINGMVGTVIVR